MILVGRASESASRQSDCLGLRHNPLSCSPASKMSGSNTAFWCAISPKRYDSVTGAIEPRLQRWQRATPQFHCRAEVKTAPKGRVTPKILSKLHGLCSVRKHTLKFPGFRKFRDPETEFCKEPWPGAFCEMQFWPEGDKAPSKANFQALEGALEILFYWNVCANVCAR